MTESASGDEGKGHLDFRRFAALEDAVDAVEVERQRLAGLLESRIISPLNLLLAQANAYEQTMSNTSQFVNRLAAAGVELSVEMFKV